MESSNSDLCVNPQSSRELEARPPTVTKERRILRSPYRAEALELMLMALRRRNNLDAILVTDDHGLLLAGAAVSGIDLDFLAATLAEPQPRDQIPNLATLTFKLDAPFHIGAIGSGPGLDSSLAEAVRGASRILAQ